MKRVDDDLRREAAALFVELAELHERSRWADTRLFALLQAEAALADTDAELVEVAGRLGASACMDLAGYITAAFDSVEGHSAGLTKPVSSLWPEGTWPIDWAARRPVDD